MKEITLKISGKMKEIELKPKTLLQQLKESLLNDTFYDFIANNYYKFSKEQLCDIIKCYDDTRYQLENNVIWKWEFIDKLIENLNDYDFFIEE
jgi:hypothetical protein